MNRPEQHIIETKSQRIFENIIPPEWIIKEIKPDYGIDYIIEVFKDNKSTGQIFFVQLKGSDQKIENSTFKKQLDIEYLNYYSSLALPVLLVLVSIEWNLVWAIWANNILESIKLTNKQMSVQIKLDSKYLIDKNSIFDIVKNFKKANQLGIRFSVFGKKEELLCNNLINWIEYYYKENVSTKFNYLPNHVEVIITSISDSESLIKIKAPNFYEEVVIGNLSLDNFYLNQPKFNVEYINDINVDFLKVLATCFAKFNIKSSLEIYKKIISKLKIETDKDFNSFNPLALLILAVENDQLFLFNSLIKKIIDSGNISLFLFCDLAYFSYGAELEELQELRIENLKRAIATSKDDVEKATCYYNLGNILKSSRELDESFHCYYLARKLLKDYEKSDYWWREVGSILFSKGHHYYAQYFYEKSIELSELSPKNVFRFEKGNPPYLIKAFIADCLFMQGRFSNAKLEFEKYIEISKTQDWEWSLKLMVCENIINLGLDNVVFNREESISYCEKAISSNSVDQSLIYYQKALEYYPLNTLAWFNLGVAYNRLKKSQNALLSFLHAGLICTSDNESIFNAILVSFNLKKNEMLIPLVYYSYQKQGLAVINNFSDYLMNTDQPLRIKKEFVADFEQLINSIEKEKSTLNTDN